jgi:L-ribulose-5-phosphate 4-epimerase
VPVTRDLTENEVQEAYETHTGRVIIERFQQLDPLDVPAVLVAGHAPFVWGRSVADSVQNAIALEAVAEMAAGTWRIRPDAAGLASYILAKHHQRKHGPEAYYGQRGCSPFNTGALPRGKAEP